MNTQSLQNTQVGAVIYITKEISDFQGDLTSWVLKAFVYVLSRFQLFETPWTVARQTPLSVGILQAGILEWVAIPPPPGDLPNPEIDPRSPTLQVDSLPSELPGKPKNNGVVAYPFSRGSSQPRSQSRVSCVAGGFCISWATREVCWSMIR